MNRTCEECLLKLKPEQYAECSVRHAAHIKGLINRDLDSDSDRSRETCKAGFSLLSEDEVEFQNQPPPNFRHCGLLSVDDFGLQCRSTSRQLEYRPRVTALLQFWLGAIPVSL